MASSLRHLNLRLPELVHTGDPCIVAISCCTKSALVLDRLDHRLRISELRTSGDLSTI